MLSESDIVQLVHDQPDHAADARFLRERLGDDADRRLSDLCRRGILRRSGGWYGALRYILGPAGQELLAQHQQQMDERARQKADEDRKHRADRADAVLDQQKEFRHDFKVAAFTVALTLFVEHLPDVVKAVKCLLEIAGLLHD